MTTNTDKTILLVEDDIIIGITESKQLQKEGYNIIHVANGEDAIDSLNNTKIDLVLMDIDLGKGIDGIQTATEILKKQNIPIVFLSSRTEKEIVEKTEGVTSFGFVSKSSSIIAINASIKMAFKLYEANLRLEREKEELRTILQSIGDAVIATDNEWKIIRMNPIAENLTGWKISEAFGKSIEEIFRLLDSNANEFIQQPIFMHLQNLTGNTNHFLLLAKDGNEYQISISFSPVKDVSGNIKGIVLIFRDISQEFETQRKIEASEKKYKAIIDASPVPFALNDDNQNILLLNKAFTDTFGYTIDDIPTLSDWWPKAYPDLEYRDWVAKTWQERIEKAALNNQPFMPLEIIIHCKNGSKRTVIARAASLGDTLFGIHLVILYDITERKESEQAIRHLLDEKELILQEVHHRVKNNMSTISGLLNIESETAKNFPIKNILQDSAGRVRSMMVLYDKLYRSENKESISVKEYFPQLISEIIRLFPLHETVEVETTIDDIILDAKPLSSLGILINELITNTMKYAFNKFENSKIRITIKKMNDYILLIYSDNGIGIPDYISFENPNGFGLQLIKMLVKQIKGSIILERKNGTQYTIQFIP